MSSCAEFSTTAVVCRTVCLVLTSGISGRPSSEPGLCEDPGLEPPESEFSLNNYKTRLCIIQHLNLFPTKIVIVYLSAKETHIMLFKVQ